MTSVPAGPWRKATRSQNTSNCVEVAPASIGGALVRDTKCRQAGHLSVPSVAWTAFLERATR